MVGEDLLVQFISLMVTAISEMLPGHLQPGSDHFLVKRYIRILCAELFEPAYCFLIQALVEQVFYRIDSHLFEHSFDFRIARVPSAQGFQTAGGHFKVVPFQDSLHLSYRNIPPQ